MSSYFFLNRYPLILFFVLLHLNSSYAQVQVDSLKTRVKLSKGDDSLEASVDLIQALYIENPSEAISHCQQALNKVTNSTPPDIIRQLRYWTGRTYVSLGEMDSVISIGKRLKDWSVSMDLELGVSDGLYLEGIGYYELGDRERSNYALQSALTGYESLNDSAGMALSLEKLGSIKKDLGDFDAALSFFNRALTIEETLDNKRRIAAINTSIGNVHDRQGNYDKALEAYNRSLRIKESNNDLQGIGSTLMNIGNTYFNQGNYDQALEFFSRSLELIEDFDNDQILARLLNNIGAIHFIRNEFEESRQFFTRSLNIKERLEDNQGIANSLNNIGETYLATKNYDQALDFFNRSLTLDSESGDKWGIAFSLDNIAGIYKEKEFFDQSIDYYQRALSIRKEIGDKRGSANTLLNLGRINLILEKFDLAIGNLVESQMIAEEINAIDLLMDIYAEQSSIYEESGQFDKALGAYKRFKASNDSLFNTESESIIANILEQYRTKEQQQQIELLEEREQRQKIIRNVLIYGMLIFLAFAAVFLIQRNRIKKEKAVSDKLLHNILPEEVVNELRVKGVSEAKDIQEVTVLFSDFVGFTTICEGLTAQELVTEIDTCFRAFDRIMTSNGLEKIKTIGDSYMAAGGLHNTGTGTIKDVIMAAFEMQNFIEKRAIDLTKSNKTYFEMRIGINTGPVIAGVVGERKFQFDIWGDTVNIASRMESASAPGKVNISQSTFDMLKNEEDLKFEHRGQLKAKNKGQLDMYFVELT